MFLRQIFNSALSQYSYLIGCPRTGQAIVIDPLRDIKPYQKLAEDNGLKIIAAADTHIHADYLSGTRTFAEQSDVIIYLSALGGSDWQYEWARGMNQVHLLQNDEKFSIGNILFQTLHTPGHTPEHLCYLVTDQGSGAETPIGILSGDLLFVGDVGRPDLLETAAGFKGSRKPAARDLASSLQSLTALGDELQVWPAHGAGSACGKELGNVPSSTMGYETLYNIPFQQARLSKMHLFLDTILTGQPDPPLYWAEMKRLNRDGFAPPTTTPPQLVTTETILDHLESPSAVVIDTRTSRKTFLEEHLRGCLYAPLGNTFSTVVGSFVPLDSEVFLLVENEEEAIEAALQLLRIGYDRIRGYALRPHVFADEITQALLSPLSHVRFADLNQELLAHPEFALLDARSSAEHATEHIPGAIHIPYTRLASRLAELDQRKALYVHCGSGMRASLATAFLAREGYQATAIDDHFTSWTESAISQQE